MSRQATFVRSVLTGKLEIQRANQPHNYDEDLSHGSDDRNEGSSKKSADYLTSNLLIPSSQQLNDITITMLNESQIDAILESYSTE
jgi:hypothetical protein